MVRKRSVVARLIGLLVLISPDLYAGRVSGRVVDESGQPVARAQVSIHRRISIETTAVQPGSFTPGYNDATAADLTGAFEFSNVPAGFHQVCVKSADTLHLDPCHWSRTDGRIMVATNATDTVMPPIRIERGHLLMITVDDPQSLLAARDLAKAYPALDEEVQVSVRSPVLGLLPLRPRAGVGKQRVYQMVVPFETAIPLNVTAEGFKLLDANNNRKSARVSQTLRIPRGAVGRQVSLRLEPR